MAMNGWLYHVDGGDDDGGVDAGALNVVLDYDYGAVVEDIGGVIWVGGVLQRMETCATVVARV